MAGVRPPSASGGAAFEPTVVGMPPTPAAKPGYEDTVIGMPPGAAAPSYDATQKSDGSAKGALDKAALMRPGEPGSPAGDGKTDLKA
jgi:hypothetical protein